MIIRVVDIETCGLPPDNMQVVEIATVDLMSAVDIETPVKIRGRCGPEDACGHRWSIQAVRFRPRRVRSTTSPTTWSGTRPPLTR